MIVGRMSQRTADRPQGASLSEHRKVFANLNSRSLRGDRSKFTANVFGGFWLHIETVVLSQSARQENEDDRPGRLPSAVACDVGGTQVVHMIHTQTQQSDSAGLDRGAPIEHRMSHAGKLSRIDTLSVLK